jgi:uncharacterized membrane protein YfcA
LLAVVSILLWRDKAKGNESAIAKDNDSDLSGEYEDPSQGKTIRYEPKSIPMGLAAGFAAGNLSGLLGVGGGILKVPILHLYCGMPMKAAAATSNFMIGITAATSAVVYFGRGDIDPSLSGSVAFGVLIGSRFGATISGKFKDSNLRKAFALLTVFLSIQMIRKALYGG